MHDLEGPKANVWDRESEAYFIGIGINTEYDPRLYSSVHYVVRPNGKAKVTIIQVRTLSEEVWGEVNHKFNYPHPMESVACSEQIKVLARVASSCTRLVDSIFASHADWLAGKTGTKETPPLAAAPAPASLLRNGSKTKWRGTTRPLKNLNDVWSRRQSRQSTFRWIARKSKACSRKFRRSVPRRHPRDRRD